MLDLPSSFAFGFAPSAAKCLRENRHRLAQSCDSTRATRRQRRSAERLIEAFGPLRTGITTCCLGTIEASGKLGLAFIQ